VTDPLFLTIQVIGILAVLVLGIGMIVLARAINRIFRTLRKVDAALDGIGQDLRPVLDRARAVGENLNFIVMSLRKEVDRVSDTVAVANDRLEEVLEAAEERVQELGALLDVVQGEVEDTLLTATSTLRGIRAGARMLRRRDRNDEGDAEVKGGDDEE
jgi:uncharacterized protein YoxC